jgi:hypothetical protein
MKNSRSKHHVCELVELHLRERYGSVQTLDPVEDVNTIAECMWKSDSRLRRQHKSAADLKPVVAQSLAEVMGTDITDL